MDPSRLSEALDLLGSLLAERGTPVRLLAIGGGAMLLGGLTRRATADLDVVAQHITAGWVRGRPLPAHLTAAIDEVARALGLPDGSSDTPWLNAAPAFLFDMGLPTGWESRTIARVFGALTIDVVGRRDLLFLKLWSATDVRTPARRARDVADLRLLAPAREELLAAARWCRDKDGAPGFVFASGILDVLGALGHEVAATEVGDD